MWLQGLTRLCCVLLTVCLARAASAVPQASDEESGLSTSGSGASGNTSGAPSRAVLDEGIQRCVTAFEQAQLLRRKGLLLSSREQLTRCAQAQCPAVIVEKCVPWLTEVNVEIPTLVIAAHDARGRDTALVRVTIDDRVVAKRLNGRPIEVDPGMRHIELQHPYSVLVRRRLLVVQGEKARRVVVHFEALPRRGERPRTTALSPLAIGGWSLAATGLVVGTISGAVAVQRGDVMAEMCPNKVCSGRDGGLADDYAEAQMIADVSTASFAIAGAAALVGTLGLLFPVTRKPQAAGAAVALRLGGATAALVGTF